MTICEKCGHSLHCIISLKSFWFALRNELFPFPELCAIHALLAIYDIADVED